MGVVGLAGLIELLFRYSPTGAILLFIGSIAGTLFIMQREGHGKAAAIAGGAAFAFALAGMPVLERSRVSSVQTNAWV